MSQDRLAAELGVHRVTVARWESGERRPRAEMRRRYADLLAALEREMRVNEAPTETRLRCLRKGKAWSLAVVGSLTFIQPSRLSALERRLAVPSTLEFSRLCGIFDWPTDRAGELLDDVDAEADQA